MQGRGVLWGGGRLVWRWLALAIGQKRVRRVDGCVRGSLHGWVPFLTYQQRRLLLGGSLFPRRPFGCRKHPPGFLREGMQCVRLHVDACVKCFNALVHSEVKPAALGVSGTPDEPKLFITCNIRACRPRASRRRVCARPVRRYTVNTSFRFRNPS
jgi:hypothetical protein